MFLPAAFMLMDNMLKCAMHLCHSISSGDRAEIVEKLSFFSSFTIFRADCCVLYGSGAMIQSLCVDWRKALRCVWSVNTRTHCDIISSLSNQFPII